MPLIQITTAEIAEYEKKIKLMEQVIENQDRMIYLMQGVLVKVGILKCS